MERALFKYLDFLLPLHNYVVIPDFGAFILNIETAKTDIYGRVIPPACSIVFNPELKYNDGILTSYIIKDDKISHNAASQKIKESVKSIKSNLRQGKVIKCGNIGSLSLDDSDNIIFLANKTFVYPCHFGLKGTTLSRIEELVYAETREKRNYSIKYIAGYAAAAALALLLFIGPNTNISDYQNSAQPIQKAGFITSLSESYAVDNSAKDSESVSCLKNPVQQLTESETKSEDIQVVKPARIYYIIIGGEETPSRANKLLDKIRTADFPEAQIIQSADRYRIYVTSFTDKPTAESFLENFRKENPNYQTAWLYSKKNR